MSDRAGKRGSTPAARPKAAVRAATPDDALAMSDLHASAFHRGWGADEIERLLLDRQVLAHVATFPGEVAGFILSRRAADEAEVLSIVVERRTRRYGLGRALLRAHLDALGTGPTRCVFLEVDENNAAARALYADEDFAEVGRRRDYYGSEGTKRASALVLCRELRARLTERDERGF